ncbi:MAG: hypothetical protein JOS17DRAFT_785733 [Linnemannia elongata]|nr:MAG: hypothetical protein JOS17DRAFT_785733 [Linnemannia elongata]
MTTTPFGIKLDDYYIKGYALVTGGQSIDSFVFQKGATPLSTQSEVAMLTITYFIVIFGGRQIMWNQDAFKLRPLFILHNLLLTRLELLYYLNYLVKYWELADTIFLVLKKKPLARRTYVGLLGAPHSQLVSPRPDKAKAVKQQQHRSANITPKTVKSGSSGPKKSKSKHISLSPSPKN